MNLILSTFSLGALAPLGMTLLHSLWQGALLWLILSLALKWLKPASASERYFMAGATLIAMLIWMGITYIDQAHSASEIALVENVETANAIGMGSSFEEARPEIQSTNSEHIQTLFSYLSPYLVLLWLTGVAFFCFRFIAAWGQVWYLRSSSFAPVNLEWQNKLQALALDMEVMRDVEIKLHDKVEGPLLLGYFKPIIILPASILTQMSVGHIEAMLYHELAHIKRHDYIVRIVQSLLEVVLFYHPVFWWLSHMLNEERELCCDDLAVKKGKQEAKIYAEALLSVASLQQPQMSLAFSNPKYSLLERIQRLFSTSPDQPHSKRYMGWGVAVAIAGLVLSVLIMRTLPWQIEYPKEVLIETVLVEDEVLKHENERLKGELERLQSELKKLKKEETVLKEIVVAKPSEQEESLSKELEEKVAKLKEKVENELKGNEVPGHEPVELVESVQEEELPLVIEKNDEPGINDFVKVDQEPKALNKAEVQKAIGYPQIARDAGIEGMLVIRLLVNENGNYVKHKVLNGVHPILQKAVENKITQMRYTPAVKDGKKVKFWVDEPFGFKLLK